MRMRPWAKWFLRACAIGLFFAVMAGNDNPTRPPDSPISHPEIDTQRGAVATDALKAVADDTVEFDPKTAAQKKMMDSMEAGTVSCLDRLYTGLLMQGVRSRSQLLQMGENICTGSLKRFMATLGVPEASATLYARKTAETELNFALGQGR